MRTTTPKCQSCNGTGLPLNHRKIGSDLSALRKRLDLTQHEVANRMGISESYLAHLESGDRSWSTELIGKFHAAIRLN